MVHNSALRIFGCFRMVQGFSPRGAEDYIVKLINANRQEALCVHFLILVRAIRFGD